MKNIFLLILLLIFLYIICNGYIEKFSVGCQSIEKTPINISGGLTLPYIDKCVCSGDSLNIEKLDIDTQKYDAIDFHKFINLNENYRWHMGRHKNSSIEFINCGEEIDTKYKNLCDESIISLLKCIYNIFKISRIITYENELRIYAENPINIHITFSNNEFINIMINKYDSRSKSYISETINLKDMGKIISIEKISYNKCIKNLQNFKSHCKEKLDPNNPNPDCCQQINNYYPIYDICYKQYKLGIFPSEGIEYGKNLLKNNYDICNK